VRHARTTALHLDIVTVSRPFSFQSNSMISPTRHWQTSPSRAEI
jgi:hypothetical protein